MRAFLLAALVLGSCAGSQQAAQQTTPIVVGYDTVGSATVVTVGKKSQVTIQTGTGHVATTAKTDNTGRDASTGANGGSSQPTTTNKEPLWAILLLAGVCAVGGAWGWQKWRPRPD